MKTVLVKETQPPSNHHKCILSLVDGSKTHLTMDILQKMNLFSVMKYWFRKKEEHSKRKTITEPHSMLTLCNHGQMHTLMQ